MLLTDCLGCSWASALCILWAAAAAAAAEQPFSVPITKVFTDVADSPRSNPAPHSTAHTVTGSRALDDTSGAPVFPTPESASNHASGSVAPTVGPQVATAPTGRPPLALSTSPRALASPAATTAIVRPASPSPAHGTTRRVETTPPPRVPPATPSRHSTLLTASSSSSSSSSPPPVQVEPAEERNPGEPAVEPNTEPQAAPVPLCDYDPCVHLQRPCPELRHAQGWSCRCLAQSAAGPRATPGPVVALEVTRAWPTAARVRWCAPDSALSAFLVWVLRSDGSAVSNASVSAWTRQTDVFGLSAGGHAYRVCVSAQSAAGALSHRRCVAVATAGDAAAIALYVLSGVCGALLLAAVVLSLCLQRQCERRRGEAPRGEPAAHGIHDPRLTCSMVSIANPAYTPADEQAVAASAHCAQRPPTKKTTNVR